MTQVALPNNFADSDVYIDPTGEVDMTSGAHGQARPWAKWLEPASVLPTYAGVVIVAIGFALIGVAWAEIAALTNVGLQMPYLVSAGFTGLGLVMFGLIVINVAAKRQDGAERARQMQTLTETFQALQREIAKLDVPRDDS